jgi:hypothetical protein
MTNLLVKIERHYDVSSIWHSNKPLYLAQCGYQSIRKEE